MSFDDSELIPPGSRLLYIGPPKTGTSTLQRAARARRQVLLENGVLYPGTSLNHQLEVAALLNRRLWRDRSIKRRLNPGSAGAVPAMSKWEELMGEVNNEQTRRILISSELAGSATEEEASKLVDALGPNKTHVVITLRPLSAMLPSRWIQSVKALGLADSFETWLKRIYGDLGPPISPGVQRYLDQGGLVERWANCVGAENTTVIILDKPDRLTNSFEKMLGLPDRTLTGAVSGGHATNRSLTKPEAEIFQRANHIITNDDAVSWPIYYDTIVFGASSQILNTRQPNESEPKLRLPNWAAERANHDAKQYADQIAKSKVNIIGPLSALEFDTTEHANPTIGTTVDECIEIAAEALAGAYKGAKRFETKILKQTGTATKSKRRTKPDENQKTKMAEMPKTERINVAVNTFSTKELLQAVRIRIQMRYISKLKKSTKAFVQKNQRDKP